MKLAAKLLLIAIIAACISVAACLSIDVQTGGLKNNERHNDQTVGVRNEKEEEETK